MTPDNKYYLKIKMNYYYHEHQNVFLSGDRYHIQNRFIIFNRKW